MPDAPPILTILLDVGYSILVYLCYIRRIAGSARLASFSKSKLFPTLQRRGGLSQSAATKMTLGIDVDERTGRHWEKLFGKQ